MNQNLKIKKRDGKVENFDSKKIEKAVQKAFLATDKELTDYAVKKSKAISAFIMNKEIMDKSILSVEEIQDMVEYGLMSTKRKDVARNYILYRQERTAERMKNNETMKVIREKLAAKNVKNQNANVDEHSFGGRMGEANEALLKQLALDEYLTPRAKHNHLANRIYTHDLAHYPLGDHNCFDGDTCFITDKGIRRFNSFSNGDKVKVLDKNGRWREATVKNYGNKHMQLVYFKRKAGDKSIYKTVKCTPDHRWLLSDNSVTTDLKVGDKLYPLTDITGFTFNENCRELYCLGYVLSQNKSDTYIGKVVLKDRSHKEPFEQEGYLKSINLKGELEYRKSFGININKFLEDKLWQYNNLESKIAFINGFVKGSITKQDENFIYITLYSSKAVQTMIDLGPVAGFHTSFVEYDNDSKEYHMMLTIGFSYVDTWEVINIDQEEISRRDSAWCVEEPETHTFTLADGMVTGNCLSIPFDDILAKGFKVRSRDIRPARSASTALQLVAVIFQLQSLNQFGGASATHLDYTLVPYVRRSFYKHYMTEYIKSLDEFYEIQLNKTKYDDLDDWVDEQIDKYLKENNLTFEDFRFDNKENLNLKFYQVALYETIKEVYQSVEALYHNLNTLQSRSGNQLPFTSINYGTCTLPEGRLIIKALLDNSIKGIGKLHKTSIFPCGIFKLKKGVNREPGDPNYDLFQLALKSTAVRLYPNYANVDWSGNEGYDPNDPKTEFSTMGKCKLAHLKSFEPCA